ncbi:MULTISPECIES: DUF4145 domain-containing protein [unclassified Streptomyces]|uniref:DUF4145 domain-containing protein n=1 Tax=unclassified Streptomyces TaxID=2593676 RepID=UPI000B828F12|nr:DUF4145 domain-containing protein [Streptomyces sp. MnatMP-M77]
MSTDPTPPRGRGAQPRYGHSPPRRTTRPGTGAPSRTGRPVGHAVPATLPLALGAQEHSESGLRERAQADRRHCLRSARLPVDIRSPRSGCSCPSCCRSHGQGPRRHLPGPLVAKIDEMHKQNLMRDITRELAHEIRERGNEIAHGDLAGEPMPAGDAEAIVAFMDEILEEVYQGPARMLALQKDRLERERRKGEKKQGP